MATRSDAEDRAGEAGDDSSLDERKSTILRKVVAEHIETGQPVGSAHLARDRSVAVSPATVRSDMAVLEREGYLTHPHTSAGRIPTDRGYRFFVDHLEQATLDQADEIQVQEFFASAHGELERMLRDTSLLLSQLTDSAAVVVAPTGSRLEVRSALLTRLAPSLALVVVVLSNGVVAKESVEISELLDEKQIERAQMQIRELLVGHPLAAARAATPGDDSEVNTLVGACLALLRERGEQAKDTGEVYVGGTARMAEQFAALDKVREVLTILEQSFVVVSLIRDVLGNGTQVSIGAEHHLEPLAECSLVVAPYTAGDEVLGTIAVLGPTRMNYALALAAVAGVSRHLGSQLSGG